MTAKDLVRVISELRKQPGSCGMVRLADSGLAVEYTWPNGIKEYVRTLSGGRQLAQRIMDGEPSPPESEQAIIIS